MTSPMGPASRRMGAEPHGLTRALTSRRSNPEFDKLPVQSDMNKPATNCPSIAPSRAVAGCRAQSHPGPPA
jgi:hypothetical protein